ncbi:PREDICTED: 39S ribosomal protein L10, mitochondrial, partial [Eurypyga helias]|uniref:39S ribosomal protein L10, mitochondrial n=1 Tax=Eurypyga helias TaxID=54383 RepID=UPI000528F745
HFQRQKLMAVTEYLPPRPAIPPRCLPRTKETLQEIVRPVLSQSKYKNLLPLFVARNILLVSRETKVKEMLRVLKGVPQVNLL